SLLSLPILARPLRFDPHWAGAQLIPPRSSATRAAAMESPGGGADARARSRQYDYGANSNLVVNTGSRPRDAHHEPTGEPQTLSGRIRARSFGDRAVRTRPPGLEEKRGESRGKKARDAASADLPHRDAKRVRRGSVRPEDNVLSLAHDALYKPRTRETRTAYEALLSVIQRQLGGQPLDVLGDAADEVLAALKDDRIRNPDKKKTCHSMMILALLLSSKRMRMIRSITFISDQVQDELDGENEDDLVELNVPGTMQTGGELYDDDLQSCNKDLTLDVQDIDAYWLQRKISQAYEDIDPQHSQKLAEEILKVIAEGDDRDVENRLVTLLDYKNFDLIKLLLHNRLKIVWCTFLARAEDQEQRKKIAEEMMSNPRLAPILEQLHATRASAKERQKNLERSIRDEAKRLLKNNSAGTDGARDSKAVDIKSGWFKGQRQLLDLDNLSFHQGSLLMSNKKCELPPGSFRTPQRGYEEVHVPALRPMPYESAEKIVKISDMPEWARPAFAGMTQLNRVQSKVYDTALYKPDNILLCAPTGAGKTNVAVLTILQQIGLHMKDGEFDNTKYKIVYVAPMKALVAEVVGNLSARLKEYNVTVSELSGDQNLTKQQIDETQIIVTTPEKWDIVTRKSGDRIYTQLVKLLIIDEIHLLHDNRGPVLESIVSRTVRQIEMTREHIRLVGLSATLPNYEDIAVFLRVCSGGLFHFDNSYRPCPLAQQYIGITARKPLQRFQLMNEICYEKVMAAAGKHQVLIFVHSRKETAQTARAIRDTALANDVLARFLKDDSASQEILCAHAELVKSSDLKDLLPYGFAIHHAGLARVDRELVEKLFVDKHIQVLISTATLAWGVNLPAHTVIIKGTQIYNSEKGAWTELSPLDVMQMLGRAGRPQYDTHGEGIILTSHSELQYYLSLMSQQLPIESQFISKLADQLNAEIVLGTIQNAQEACSWLGYTYLYIRMLRNPTLYGLPEDIMERDRTLDERRADLVHSAANLLDRNNLKYDKRTGYFQATDLGRISSYYYISHRTISTYNEYLKPTMGYIELCQLFSLSEEFKYVSVRKDEKMELEKILDRVPIPVKESLEEPSTKINVLLQAYISGLKLEGLSLGSDMVYIKQSAGRLSRAIFEIVLKRGWSQLAEKALNLCTMIDKQMWSVQTPLRQFPGIPNEILMKLEKKELAWERYFDLSSQEIGELIRYPKMGRRLYQCIHQLPKLNLSAHVQPITRTVLGFELTLTPDFQWDDKIHGYVEPFWILVEDNDSECILHHEYFTLKKQRLNEDHTLNFTVPIYEPLPPLYFIHVVSDKWLGSRTILPVSFRHLVLPDKHAPPTELLDLQPLPVTALRNARYEGLYSAWKHFNPIQTQVFSVLYNSDHSVLVAAPTGSGKTICAKFAILRNHQKAVSGETNMRIVYIAPIEALAKERYRDWEMKFGEFACVVELTGETARDLKLLDKGEIIISTHEKWDSLSRRWKQRKHIQQVGLFIVDELHLIGSEKGHVLDIIVSRMRCIANHTCSNIRIVALSASLANAKDLGEWIGATSHGLFNFPPAVRRYL
uniref:RNA helicase n=3 Tax=Aegilops tauschii subsp. strangulata TaxID=200361 RepID=A0A453R8X1_AEGTS